MTKYVEDEDTNRFSFDFLLNLFFTGQIKTMAPRLTSDDGRNIVIRPLLYCPEDQIQVFADELGFTPAPCTLCTDQDGLKRQMVKGLVEELAALWALVR